MKRTVFKLFSIALLFVSPSFAQVPKNGVPATNQVGLEAVIPGKISDGTPSPSSPPLVLPDFKVKSTVVREMDVVEAPLMSGLPLIEGTITVTAHLVDDPELPDPPPPLVPADDPKVNSPFDTPNAKSERSGFAFISATVYDHTRTLLRCHLNGNVEKEITAWSNLDFNHFTGFSTFKVRAADGKVRSYDLVMAVGDVNTQQQAELLAKHDMEYNLPEIPAIPGSKPAYVIEDAAPDAAAVQLVEDLHELYRCEGPRMEAAYHARIKAEAEQRAYYLAHPPVPKNVTMSFWERDHPVGLSADTIKKGGGN